MKNILRRSYKAVILCLLLLCFSCERPEDIEKGEKISVGLINPTIESLRGFALLVENNVFKIDNLQLVAINYQKAERNISSVVEYIQERDDDLFRFEMIEGEIDSKDLFRKNELSGHFETIVNMTDGLFFLGGADFPPAIYGEKTNLLTSIQTPHRHNFELSFLYHLLGGRQDTSFIPFLEKKPNFVVIGFCLGMQSMNVATGGSMYQDIPSEVYNKTYVEDVLHLGPDQQHRNYWQNLKPDREMIWSYFHRIKPIKAHHFFNDTLWQDNPTPDVYSSHHQAIKQPGLNLEIITTSIDGKIPEIITHTRYKNVFGVQFHPEVFSLYHDNGRQYKWFPDDSVRKSYHTYLKETNSLGFHKQLWNKIGDLFLN